MIESKTATEKLHLKYITIFLRETPLICEWVKNYNDRMTTPPDEWCYERLSFLRGIVTHNNSLVVSVVMLPISVCWFLTLSMTRNNNNNNDNNNNNNNNINNNNNNNNNNK